MREFRSHGSVRGALRNERPYREHRLGCVDLFDAFRDASGQHQELNRFPVGYLVAGRMHSLIPHASQIYRSISARQLGRRSILSNAEIVCEGERHVTPARSARFLISVSRSLHPSIIAAVGEVEARFKRDGANEFDGRRSVTPAFSAIVWTWASSDPKDNSVLPYFMDRIRSIAPAIRSCRIDTTTITQIVRWSPSIGQETG